ncbi:MAG TPA: HAD family hydrolase [Cellvibrionaceae bacterium]
MIFFDIDDTLLDHKASQDAAALAFAIKYSDHIENPAAFPAAWHKITKRHMTCYLSGKISFQEQRRRRIQESLPLQLSAAETDKIFDDYYQSYEASWRLFPEVEDVLHKLSDLHLGIITNGDKEQQCYKLEKLGIHKHFHQVITPTCAGEAKPAPAIFKFAASQADKSINQCWYIGDNHSTDYLGAKNAGFRSVWLNRSGSKAQCDSQCRDLNEFLLTLEEEF